MLHQFLLLFHFWKLLLLNHVVLVHRLDFLQVCNPWSLWGLCPAHLRDDALSVLYHSVHPDLRLRSAVACARFCVPAIEEQVWRLHFTLYLVINELLKVFRLWRTDKPGAYSLTSWCKESCAFLESPFHHLDIGHPPALLIGGVSAVAHGGSLLVDLQSQVIDLVLQSFLGFLLEILSLVVVELLPNASGFIWDCFVWYRFWFYNVWGV